MCRPLGEGVGLFLAGSAQVELSLHRAPSCGTWNLTVNLDRIQDPLGPRLAGRAQGSGAKGCEAPQSRVLTGPLKTRFLLSNSIFS